MFEIEKEIPMKMRKSKGAYHQVVSPNDLEVLTEVQYATDEDIDFVLKNLKGAQENAKKLPPFERAAILRKVAQLMRRDEASLAHLIATEGGKPLKDAKVEVSRAQNTIELCAEEAVRLAGEMIPMERTPAGKDHIAFTFREPIGPVLALSAFNHPLNLLCHQAGAAIGSGCALVLKPAPGTPLCGEKLFSYFQEAGLPAGIFILLHADVPQIERLVSSLEFGFVSFIGSARVGWALRQKIAPGTRLALEHGGQAPAIVAEDADLEQAVNALLKGAYYHAGQVCISTQKIFVHERIFEKFLGRFKEETLKLKTGDARDEATDVGPLIRPSEVKRIQEWIREALGQGATLVCGNEVKDKGQYLLPTILTNSPLDSKIMREEVFGPVVTINSYTAEGELLSSLNENPYVFEAALFTNDINRAFQYVRELSTMTLVINNHNALRTDWMPFGGHKLSGLGMGGVRYEMEEMTRIKQVIIKTS
jgi:acyl-CoA reductase-like NAD-dependent aldehyde dehydrogenase